MFRQVKVSAISFKPKRWDKTGNADKLETLFREAAKEEPEVILAPEAVLDGYVAMDVIAHPGKKEAFFEIADPIDGPCSGRICGKYHKVWLAEGYHDSWNINRIGKSIKAIDTPLGRLGFVICADRWNPVITHTLVLDGARIIFISSYGNKKKNQNQAVLARARENGVPIVEANVGMNLIISKGEIAAYDWGNDIITTAVIEVPEAPSPEASARSEKLFLKEQAVEMKKRYGNIDELSRRSRHVSRDD